MPNPTNFHEIYDRAYVQNSCEWFLESDEFRKWKEKVGSIIWVVGKGKYRTRTHEVHDAEDHRLAGSGKTVLWCVRKSLCIHSIHEL
jgi:hypothetical protein